MFFFSKYSSCFPTGLILRIHIHFIYSFINYKTLLSINTIDIILFKRRPYVSPWYGLQLPVGYGHTGPVLLGISHLECGAGVGTA